MLEPLRNSVNWDNFRKVAVLVLILWAAASVLFGIIYFFILGGRSPVPANIFRALILLVPFIAQADSPDGLKLKNPEAPAVKREAEEDWEKEKLEMTDQKPWRLEDLVFESMGDDLREWAKIDGVEIVRQDGRYWINSPYAQWSNLDDREVDPALDFLFNKRRGGQ